MEEVSSPTSVVEDEPLIPMKSEEQVKASASVDADNDRTGEFDPGSERTLAGGLTHASRATGFGRERRTGE